MITEDGLIVTRNDGRDEHLGYLFVYGELVFSPEGPVSNITPAEADKHNEVLSSAEVRCLFENADVKQGRVFYLVPNHSGVLDIRTWHGDLIYEALPPRVKFPFVFARGSKTFEAKPMRGSQELVFVRRIS